MLWIVCARHLRGPSTTGPWACLLFLLVSLCAMALNDEGFILVEEPGSSAQVHTTAVHSASTSLGTQASASGLQHGWLDAVTAAAGLDLEDLPVAPHADSGEEGVAPGSVLTSAPQHFSLADVFGDSDNDEEWGKPICEDEEELLDLGTFDNLPDSWFGGDGFVPEQWLYDQAALERALSGFGLYEALLASQEGEELELLER